MVRRLHAAGIEVLLDVVYNHTAEGDEHGPTSAGAGWTTPAGTACRPTTAAAYENWSGCGNTFNVHHPRGLQLVMDSLRYWVQHMHVDGFRFDLAPVLGRGDGAFEPQGAFFKALQQDPVLAGCKLIAEPWDLGPDGYQLGRFPHGWLEWNDRFRDTARAFWLGGDCTRGELARRWRARQTSSRPRALAAGIGELRGVARRFHAADLVSYDLRHNEANLEGNRDGHGHNLSWNCGWEGPTDDPEVRSAARRLQRALLATVLLSQGTPMLAAGDELGHSQGGNNNPYCQDNTITWIDWNAGRRGRCCLHRAPDRAAPPAAAAGRALVHRAARCPGPRRPGLVAASGQPLAADDWNDRMSRVLGGHIGAPGSRATCRCCCCSTPATPMSTSSCRPASWQLELDSAEPGAERDWAGSGRIPAARAQRGLAGAAGTRPPSSQDRCAMRLPRASGVLLHITSLPGPYGSGDLGAEARHFVDWLASGRAAAVAGAAAGRHRAGPFAVHEPLGLCRQRDG
jgi:glycogen operon protein